MRESSNPNDPDQMLTTEAEITIDFGKGIKRHYTIVNHSLRKGLMDGAHWQIEFCHPNFGEVLIARRIK